MAQKKLKHLAGSFSKAFNLLINTNNSSKQLFSEMLFVGGKKEDFVLEDVIKCVKRCDLMSKAIELASRFYQIDMVMSKQWFV